MKTTDRITNPSRSFDIEISNEYFTWLCNIININRPRDSYFILAQILHKRDYKWFVPNDDNRAADGRKLREQFSDEMQYDASKILNYHSCSMLEMLVGVARRIEDILYDPEEGDRTERWFWEILGNVGLDKYVDSKYAEDSYGREKINLLIDNVLERAYKKNGQGGLFPLRRPKKDQRKVEIWYQMCEYLNDNYFINGSIL